MILLFKTALQNRKHYILLVFAVILMWMSTIAGQSEMFAAGILTNKGADVFELFAPEKGDKLVPGNEITFKDVKERWSRIQAEKEGVITQQEANDFLMQKDKGNLFKRTVHFVDARMNITGNILNLMKLLLVVALFMAVTTFGSKYAMQLVSIRVSRDLRHKYFKHIQTLPMSFYKQYNIGSLSARVVGDAGVVAGAINSLLVNYVQTPFTIVTSLAICFYLSFNLSLIIFFGLPLILVPLYFLSVRIKAIAKQIQKNQESFTSVLIDFLAGIQTVKVFAMEEFSLRKYADQNSRMAVLEEKSARYSLIARPVIHLISSLFLVVVILYALYVEHLGLSEIVVFVGILHQFYEPIKKFADENNTIQRGVAAAERMYEVLNIKPLVDDHDGAIPLEGHHHSIEFKDVWFRYEDEWILQGVSFTAKKGEIVALVGPTGAGKSTVAQLLPRLYDIQKGEILIDGRPITSYTQKSLREHIAFVPQKPFLFIDTIAENIAFGRDFSEEQIEDAARRAHADEFIQSIPGKYHSMLLETGQNLSGGQQQRLAIARALVKDAPILIMDEATSALDGVSEHRIKMAIQDLHGEVTQILIAHRLTTIEHADKIVYLEHGKKIDEGTKDELLLSCPGFRLMWEMVHHPEDENIQS